MVSPPEEKMKTKSQKQSIIDELKQNLEKTKAIIILNLHKLNTSNLFKLKKELKNNGSALKVAKKTFFELSKSEIQTDNIKGPFALIFDFSPNLKPFSILGKLKKELQLKVFGGFLGDKVLSEKEVWGIAELPSEDNLKAKLIYTLKSRFQTAIFNLKTPLNKLVIVLNQINSKSRDL